MRNCKHIRVQFYNSQRALPWLEGSRNSAHFIKSIIISDQLLTSALSHMSISSILAQHMLDYYANE